MLRKNVLPENFDATSLKCANKNGKFRAIFSANNIQVRASVKKQPNQEPNPSFLVYVDKDTSNCIHKIVSHLQTLLPDTTIKDPLYIPPSDDDEQPTKKKRTQRSLRVKIKDASTIIQKINLENTTSGYIQRDAQVILSLKADYLFDLGTCETLTFTATRIVCKESEEQQATILLDGQASNTHTTRVNEGDWLSTLQANEPNPGLNRMVYLDWSRTPKLQVEGSNKFGIDFSHEYNQGKKIDYLMNCDEDTVNTLTRLDELTEQVVTKAAIFGKKMKDAKQTHIVNRKNPQYPKVRLKFQRGKTTIHRLDNSNNIVPGTESDLSLPDNKVICLVRPNCINCSSS